MSGFENWPAPILRRWLLSAAAGPVIFLIGLAGRIALHDPTLLTLSTLLASCIVVRCILLFQAIRQGAYETVEGVCVAIRRASLRGHQRIRLMDDSGTAHDLLLDRRQRFLIGSSYRIYLQSSPGAALPEARIPHGALLGLEVGVRVPARSGDRLSACRAGRPKYHRNERNTMSEHNTPKLNIIADVSVGSSRPRGDAE